MFFVYWWIKGVGELGVSFLGRVIVYGARFRTRNFS